MIHGKTKIELYNPNTKIKQIIREENTFQSSVLASYMRSLGEANNNPFANSTFKGAKSWQNLVGGIFLFKNAIDISGGVVNYMPSGNQMIANGSYLVSNGSSENDPTEMGSWNAQESSASVSAITQVYDWETNQGNGTIGCICLTSQTGGYIGYGNESGKVKTQRNFGNNQSAISVDQSNVHSNNAVVVGNMRYEFEVNSGIVTVKKTIVGISQGSVFQGFYTTKSFDLSEVGNHLGISSEEFYPILDGNDLYLLSTKAQSVSANGNGYLYKYNVSNDTLEEISFVNSSTITFNMATGAQLSKRCGVSNGCIFGNNSNGKISVIKLSNSEYIGEIDVVTGTGAWQYLNVGLRFLDDFTANGGINGYWYLYDHTNGALRPTNGTFSFERQIFQDKTNNALQVQNGGGNVSLFKNPLYLATVNNLQSPVTKTAAQTMKVTYTLTET